MSHLKLVSPLATCILIALFATPVIAHETGTPHDETVAQASLDASASASAETNLRMKPLDVIKARARQIKDGAQNVQLPVRASATSSVRVQMNQGRASTTDGRGGLQALVRFHGGEIKNRFRLAISHMNNLLMRIDTRLGKMAAAGVDTTSVAQLKVDAELALDKAEVDAQAIADFVAGVEESSDHASVRAELHAKIKTAHDSVKAAHAAVMKVVRALVQLAKDNKDKLKVEASVSATTSVQ